MTLYALIFYPVAALIVAATTLAITRRDPVHAVIYLVISFFGSAMLFYLLGAPFLAALEVIIYAGAIMVLFLFVIMMLNVGNAATKGFPPRQWGPAIGLGALFFVLAVLTLSGDPASRIPLHAAMAAPKEFGRFVFKRYGLSVEIISILLLLGLLAAIQVGREEGGEEEEEKKNK